MIQVNPDDGGHRHGNFHNYYSFHSCAARLNVLRECGFLDFIIHPHHSDDTNACGKDITSPYSSSTDQVIYYCDFGCNEGDLTLDMAKLLVSHHSSLDCKVCGLDIDHDLISRARTKAEKDLFSDRIDAEFHVCNIIDERDHLSQCHSFLREKSSGTKSRFDLVSIFSTTMWIHIHAGDDGLKQLIERSCELSNFILIEPQPSKWYDVYRFHVCPSPQSSMYLRPHGCYSFGSYKEVNVRLRKMNRPEVDVSMKRLKLRENMEEEIERIMVQCGFQRIQEKTVEDGTVKTTTEWNRTIYLFARIHPS